MTLVSQLAIKLVNGSKEICLERTPLDVNKEIYLLAIYDSASKNLDYNLMNW